MYMCANIEGDRYPYLTASQYKGLHGAEKDKSPRKPNEGGGVSVKTHLGNDVEIAEKIVNVN